MHWKNEDYVVHKKKIDWGVGKVLYVNAQEVAVFFVNGGRRVLTQPVEFLEMAQGELHGHPLLKNVAPVVLDGTSKFLPLPDCVQYFLKLFPNGFEDEAYLTTAPKRGERHYKLNASRLAHSLLNKSDWSDLSGKGNYSEICQRLMKVESKTQLLHTMEKIKWHAALKDLALQKSLVDALFNDLYGVGDRETRFLKMAEALQEADGCAKWTIATYYGFLLQPDPRMFIKPEVTKFAAEACGWDLQYASQLNWTTVKQSEALAQYLFEELCRMGQKPRDMIDIQSFIWCIDPKSYA